MEARLLTYALLCYGVIMLSFSAFGQSYTHELTIEPDSLYSVGSVDLNSDGRCAIVGVGDRDVFSFGPGFATVYERVGNSWSPSEPLATSDAAATNAFGGRVAISGDGQYALVADTGYENSVVSAGAVFVFRRSGSTWTEEAILLHDDPVTEDDLGLSMAINHDGTRAVLGAKDNFSGAGKAFVFARDGSSWGQEAKLLPDDLDGGDAFGIDVDINALGDYIVVGSKKGGFSSTPPHVGAAYVFHRVGASWTQQAALSGEDGVDRDEFGIGVAIDRDGTTIAVGSQLDDLSDRENGSIYIFERDQTTWDQRAKLTGQEPVSPTLTPTFSLSGDGNVLVAGTPGDGDSGGANLFFRSSLQGDDWTKVNQILSPDPDTLDASGGAAALSAEGTHLILADFRANTFPREAGKARIFEIELASGLPIELIQFNATVEGSMALLEWSTSSERDNAGFWVERAYPGGVFESVVFVEGNGTTPSESQYRYKLPLWEGTHLIRLRQLDLDGTFSLSNTIEVQVNALAVPFISAFPNPAKSSTRIEFSPAMPGNVTIVVLDLLGREVATVFDGHARPAMNHGIDLSSHGLTAGTYILSLEEGAARTTRMLTILN